MRKLVDLLTESKGWEMQGKSYGMDFIWTDDTDFLWMNTEGQQIGFLSDKEIKSFAKDADMDMEDIDAILNLEPGEMYDADGGINLYIRFR